jgi:AraC family transcriptional regulator of adaptative response / DNA-3-methyladenine glycosylase II
MDAAPIDDEGDDGPVETPVALDPARCYRALRMRDARFDGRFFTGVKTTGVFCRPVCPAPLPRRHNCTFWRSAAAAQAAGFRPCLRCRPESAPGTPAWLGTAASVSRALRLIESGALDHGGSVEDLATRLGMSARHLRRLFERHLGATPRAVARMRRTLFAKQLIDETRLPMTEIAASAGFSSLRRFNACIREVYGRPPSALRRQRTGGRRGRAVSVRKSSATTGSGAGRRAETAGRRAPTRQAAEASGAIELSLAYREPFAWSALLDFLRPRAIPGVEVVTEDRYLRTTAGPGSVAVRLDPARRRLRVVVLAASSDGLIETSARLRRLFDLDADARAIDDELARARRSPASRALRRQVEACPGMRVPGAFDGFETAVRAVLGQQISVKGATTLAGRIASRWGMRLPRRPAHGDGLRYVFPTPERLAAAPLEEVGLTRARAETIRSLAGAVLADPGLLEPGAGPREDARRWMALPGIGPWTAQYVAMRVLREPDALPSGDLGLRKAIARRGEKPCSAREVEAALDGFRPYRAYAAMRLWVALGDTQRA